MICDWLLIWCLRPGAVLADELDRVRSAPATTRMSLRLQMHRFNTGRWRRGTRRVHVLRRPLEPRAARHDWSRPAVFLLAALLTVTACLLALVCRDCVFPLVRGALAPPTLAADHFCDQSPFTLGSVVFACSPADAELPAWTRLETRLERLQISIFNTIAQFLDGACGLAQ